MTYMLGRTTVADFDEWKSAFDENESFRTEHGQRGFQVYRTVDDPNEVVILFEWDEMENARDLFDSEEMRARLADAGVQGRPDMTFLEQVDARSTTRPSA